MGVVLAIVGYAVAMVVAQAVGQSAREATGVRQVAMERAIKVSIFAVAVVVALVVAGVDHTMLVVVLVALVGAPAVAFALLTASGAQGVATQISAGRALGHRFEQGWTLEVGELTGEVISMEPTFVEVLDNDGRRHQLPNAWLLERPYRAEPSF
jgi:small-conductance mechanosensitive channel